MTINPINWIRRSSFAVYRRAVRRRYERERERRFRAEDQLAEVKAVFSALSFDPRNPQGARERSKRHPREQA
jgi:hypothetical protein